MKRAIQTRPLSTSLPAAPAGYPYWYNTTINAVAAATQGWGVVNVEADSDFEVLAILATAWLSTGVAIISRSNIIGGQPTGSLTLGVGSTPTANFESLEIANLAKLPRDANPNGATVTLPGLHLLRLALVTNDRPWQNEPTPMDLLTSEPGRLFFFPRPMVIQANSTIAITLYNDMPTSTGDGTGNALRGIKGVSNGAPTVSTKISLFGSKIKRR